MKGRKRKMAKKIEQPEDKIIVPGGKIYNSVVHTEHFVPKDFFLNRLYKEAFANLVNDIGLHSNIELGLHIKVFQTIHEVYDTPNYYCRIETIPIKEEVHYVDFKPKIKPYEPNKKYTLKERLKFLFKGEL